MQHFRHEHRQQAADDLAARPPGVKHYEPARLLRRIDGDGQRVDDAFDEPLRQAHDEEADVEQRGAGVVEERDDRRRWVEGAKTMISTPDEVAGARERVQPLHADEIDERAARHDRDRRTPRTPGLNTRPSCSFVM